jgi:class 3 adenylate cyclase
MISLFPSVNSDELAAQNHEQLLTLSRHLLAEAQAVSSRIAAVNEIATAINRSLDINKILRVVSKQAKWLLDFDHCSVCLRTDEDSWYLETLFGKSVELEESDITDMNSLGRVLKTGQALWMNENFPTGFLSPFQSKIIIPLESDSYANSQGGDACIGTINFASTRPQAYTQEDLRIGYLLAVQLSAAIRNAQRFEQLNLLYEQLDEEKRKSDQLLLNILPADIAAELKYAGKVKPVHYDSASVLFTDFQNFTQLSEQLSPQELVDELDYCFSYFDQVIEAHNLEKLKTIGDSYMCVGGIPTPNQTHAIDAVLAAIHIRLFMQWRKLEKLQNNQPYWDIRIGIHSGPLLAGVIGQKKFAYDVWGDTVNTASRMESSGVPGNINISQATFELVKDLFEFQYRGKIRAKNKGKIDMYLVKRIKDNLAYDCLGILPNDNFNNLYFAKQSV